jgi:hypothetical protein
LHPAASSSPFSSPQVRFMSFTGRDFQLPDPHESPLARNTKSGGSDPTFLALSRPKEFLGSLPPDSQLTWVSKSPPSSDRMLCCIQLVRQAYLTKGMTLATLEGTPQATQVSIFQTYLIRQPGRSGSATPAFRGRSSEKKCTGTKILPHVFHF